MKGETTLVMGIYCISPIYHIYDQHLSFHKKSRLFQGSTLEHQTFYPDCDILYSCLAFLLHVEDS